MELGVESSLGRATHVGSGCWPRRHVMLIVNPHIYGYASGNLRDWKPTLRTNRRIAVFPVRLIPACPYGLHLGGNNTSSYDNLKQKCGGAMKRTLSLCNTLGASYYYSESGIPSIELAVTSTSAESKWASAQHAERLASAQVINLQRGSRHMTDL